MPPETSDYLMGDVLEVGAGFGGTTSVLHDSRLESWTCLEPDAALANQLTTNVGELRDRHGRAPKAITGTLQALAREPAFDCILYIDVLEHIKDDAAELVEAAARLRPSGWLLVLSAARRSRTWLPAWQEHLGSLAEEPLTGARQATRLSLLAGRELHSEILIATARLHGSLDDRTVDVGDAHVRVIADVTARRLPLGLTTELRYRIVLTFYSTNQEGRAQMLHHRAAASSLVMVLTLSACSLLVDANPDGLAVAGGPSGHSGERAIQGGAFQGGTVSGEPSAAGTATRGDRGGYGGSLGSTAFATAGGGLSSVAVPSEGGANTTLASGGAAVLAGAAGSLASGGVSGADGEPGNAGSTSLGPCLEDAECPATRPVCVKGACASCPPTTERCDSPASLQRCDSDGAWQPVNVNWNFDPHHCGACGHSCLGGTCSSGQCQAYAIVSGVNSPNYLTLDDRYVYFTSTKEGAVRRVIKDGSEASTIIANLLIWPRGIVRAGTLLYFTDRNYVYSLPPDGSAAPTITYTDTVATQVLGDLSTDGSMLLWHNLESIYRMPVGGNAAFINGGMPGGPSTVHLHRDFSFYAALGVATSPGYVQADSRLNGVNSARISSSELSPRSLAYDGESLYWANEGEIDPTAGRVVSNSGAIRRARFVSGSGTWNPPETVVANLAHPVDLVVDEQWVYWVSTSTEDDAPNSGSVWKVAKGGGTPVPLSVGQINPWQIAQDETAIYWTNSGSPIMRLAK